MQKTSKNPQDNASAESLGRRIQREFRDLLVESADMFHGDTSLWTCEQRIRALIDKIVTPFNIAVFGRVKAGKSSLVNALLGKRLAVVFSEEATATVNVISHVEPKSDLLSQFTVHWTDQQPETFPLEKLQTEWTGKADALLKEKVNRTGYLELYSDAECLKLHEIIDTPGLGSVVAEHERITQTFLKGEMAQRRTPDAMIYVIESVGKLSDRESIERFRESCMPGSDPYNSVGVLHKWDSEYFEHGMKGVVEKCNRLRTMLSDVVADVIPVSAPIAFFATRATNKDIRDVFALLKSTSVDDLLANLGDQEDWDDDKARLNLRMRFKNEFDCPWASFRVIIREMCLNPSCGIDTYRKHLYEDISGFGNLRTFLDRKFFRLGALIRQRQTYVQVGKIFEEAKDILWDKSREMGNELLLWRQLHCAPNGKTELRGWIDQNIAKIEGCIKSIGDLLVGIELGIEGREIVQIITDVTLREWCAGTEFDCIAKASKELIEPLLDVLSGHRKNARISLSALQRFYGELGILIDSGIEPSARKRVEQLQLRILAYVGMCKGMEVRHDGK